MLSRAPLLEAALEYAALGWLVLPLHHIEDEDAVNEPPARHSPPLRLAALQGAV
jgi:hypothetical protein